MKSSLMTSSMMLTLTSGHFTLPSRAKGIAGGGELASTNKPGVRRKPGWSLSCKYVLVVLEKSPTLKDSAYEVKEISTVKANFQENNQLNKYPTESSACMVPSGKHL